MQPLQDEPLALALQPVLEIARARDDPSFYIVDDALAVLYRCLQPAYHHAGADLPADIAAVARRLLAGSLLPERSAVALLTHDLAVRMVQIDSAGTTFAIFLEPFHARNFARTAARLHRLSPRECAVLDCMLRGATTAVIAEELGIGATTVLHHIRNIGFKVGTTKRSAIVATVLRTMPPAKGDAAPLRRPRLRSI